MKYKFLALDIDGTIVKGHTNMPTLAVIRAIQTAKKKVFLSLVSARAWKEQQILVDLLGLRDSYHVLENGTKVINPQGELEYTIYIAANEVQQIIDTVDGLFDDIGYCINNRWMQTYTCPEKEIVTTISLISYSREKAAKIPDVLRVLPTHYSVTVGAHWSESAWAVTLISHRDASKGTGIAYIQKKLNILAEETIAVGDGASDVPMMQYASQKVAMGNAEQELKRIATYIAPTVSEDGLVKVINEFVLPSDFKRWYVQKRK